MSSRDRVRRSRHIVFMLDADREQLRRLAASNGGIHAVASLTEDEDSEPRAATVVDCRSATARTVGRAAAGAASATPTDLRSVDRRSSSQRRRQSASFST